MLARIVMYFKVDGQLGWHVTAEGVYVVLGFGLAIHTLPSYYTLPSYPTIHTLPSDYQ